MSELAARLVDLMLPHGPIRPWVFTGPRPVRSQLAFDAALTRSGLRVFLRTVFSGLRQRAAQSEMETVARVLAMTALDVCQREPAELAIASRRI